MDNGCFSPSLLRQHACFERIRSSTLFTVAILGVQRCPEGCFCNLCFDLPNPAQKRPTKHGLNLKPPSNLYTRPLPLWSLLNYLIVDCFVLANPSPATLLCEKSGKHNDTYGHRRCCSCSFLAQHAAAAYFLGTDRA